tara:strand:- start:11854 stop:13800 length:1947 start_codon:yes stop_codon:yes gene_type:complete
MCGFAGFLGGSNKGGKKDVKSILRCMTDEIYRRGPDDSGIWYDSENDVGLGHRRLSIIDLSEMGHQPMMSSSGRYMLVFNGEIYNHAEIREELKNNEDNYEWRGSSDTEILLASFDRWGIRRAIDQSVGMFAFAVWDAKERSLVLGRDRMGEKPLYYGWQGDSFLFGSELKAIKKHPDFRSNINHDAVTLLLRQNNIAAPYSIYKDIYKLEPGCLLTIYASSKKTKIVRYWSLIDTAIKGVSQPFAGSEVDAVEELEALTLSVLKKQMIADVPLGAFLSGGIDSSTIVALMQAQSSSPVKTFSIGFHENKYDEAQYAKSVASYLGTDHTEVYVTPEDAMGVIPELPAVYCEPFSDASQIPTFIVSRLAREHVTVSLSGDGGDELFCGYKRYSRSKLLWWKLNKLPFFLRDFMASGINALSVEAWDKVIKILPHNMRIGYLGDRLYKASELLKFRDFNQFYRDFLLSNYRDPESLMLHGREPVTSLVGNEPDITNLDNIQKMMALDQIHYLPNDILVKVDRAAMWASLETRIPLLDHRIVEFAWSLPQSIKCRDNQTKWPLKQLLFKHVPRRLVDRPKAGFSVPLHDWLRGPLREWSEELLSENRMYHEGVFDPASVRVLWSEHQSGKRNWTHVLWSILMFQAWLEESY